MVRLIRHRSVIRLPMACELQFHYSLSASHTRTFTRHATGGERSPSLIEPSIFTYAHVPNCPTMHPSTATQLGRSSKQSERAWPRSNGEEWRSTDRAIAMAELSSVAVDGKRRLIFPYAAIAVPHRTGSSTRSVQQV